MDSLTLDIEYGYRIDNYIASDYGTQKEKDHAVSMDLTYEPSEILTLFGNYSVEKTITDIKTRYKESGTVTKLPLDLEANDWFATSEDLTDGFGLGANAAIVKWLTSLKWRFVENLILRLSYSYERYMAKDYAIDGISVWQPIITDQNNYILNSNQYVFLGWTPGNYDAHIVGLSLTYKF